jgi:two-component system NtrC family sensor kinase
MELVVDPASFWARLFRCQTRSSAEAEILASGFPDASVAIEAWSAHRSAFTTAEARLSDRARELEALQSLGRALAEARTLDDLVERLAGSLQTLADADALAIATAVPEATGVTVYLARALSPRDTERLREATALGFIPLAPDAGATRRLPGFDRLQGERGSLSEDQILVVPVERRGREIARLALVPRDRGERSLRVLFGASNHFAAHLDRVLAVAEAEEGRFRAILDSMPHAVVLTDASFQVVSANASGELLLPRVSTDISGALRSVGDLDLVSLAYDVLAGRSGEADGEARLADGGHLEITIAPWHDASGRARGLVMVILDVTTTRKLRDQITQSEKLSSLGRMIAGVAHELNNPLTSVIGYAQLLRATPPGDKLAERLDTMRREAERCRRIVQNLLRFARTHPPERRAFSLNEVVDATAQLLTYSIRGSGCRIVTDLDRSIPSVIGDVHDIEQALVNLVTNAQQAMTGGGISGAITLRTKRSESGGVALEVEDEGPGIPEDARARVFDPFFTTKPSGQGTGLGLWLVYNALTAHGGSISAAAARSGGALFRLELPAGAPAAIPEPARPVERSEDEPRVSARILVVDAEAALASLICDALTADGHHATQAGDAEQALARMLDERFDLLVSDTTIPGLSGERLAPELARLSPRILLTTGDWVSREPESVARRLNAGLLRKPFELDELRRVVRSRLRREVEP